MCRFYPCIVHEALSIYSLGWFQPNHATDKLLYFRAGILVEIGKIAIVFSMLNLTFQSRISLLFRFVKWRDSSDHVEYNAASAPDVDGLGVLLLDREQLWCQEDRCFSLKLLEDDVLVVVDVL